LNPTKFLFKLKVTQRAAYMSPGGSKENLKGGQKFYSRFVKISRVGQKFQKNAIFGQIFQKVFD
jgi:hypothetical protein